MTDNHQYYDFFYTIKLQMPRRLLIEIKVESELINSIGRIAYTPFWSHLSVHRTALVLRLSWCRLEFSHP